MTEDDAWAAAGQDARSDEPLTEAEAEAITRRAGRGAMDALRSVIEDGSTEASGTDAA